MITGTFVCLPVCLPVCLCTYLLSTCLLSACLLSACCLSVCCLYSVVCLCVMELVVLENLFSRLACNVSDYMTQEQCSTVISVFTTLSMLHDLQYNYATSSTYMKLGNCM